MSIALNTRKESDYLYVEATGTRTPESVLAVASACAVACKEHGCDRLLLDTRRMTGALTTVDTYEVAGKRLPLLGRGLSLRVAILVARENKARIQLFEDVAVNMGINLRIFSNVNAALRWLHAGKRSGSHSPTRQAT
jgi:hypothetical protein